MLITQFGRDADDGTVVCGLDSVFQCVHCLSHVWALAHPHTHWYVTLCFVCI